MESDEDVPARKLAHIKAAGKAMISPEQCVHATTNTQRCRDDYFHTLRSSLQSPTCPTEAAASQKHGPLSQKSPSPFPQRPATAGPACAEATRRSPSNRVIVVWLTAPRDGTTGFLDFEDLIHASVRRSQK